MGKSMIDFYALHILKVITYEHAKLIFEVKSVADV